MKGAVADQGVDAGSPEGQRDGERTFEHGSGAVAADGAADQDRLAAGRSPTRLVPELAVAIEDRAPIWEARIAGFRSAVERCPRAKTGRG